MKRPYCSTRELEEKIRAAHRNGGKALCLVPVGCIEQHGPYLPVETDSLIVDRAALDVCSRMEKTRHWAYACETVHYTPSRSATAYPGTVSVDEDAFRGYVEAICRALLPSLFDGVVLLCGHGPAEPSLVEIAFKLVNEQFRQNPSTARPVAVSCLYAHAAALKEQFGQEPGRHADWREFLMVYHLLGPQYFKDEKIRAMESFDAKNTFNAMGSPIPGIPLEFRSVEGVVGEPLPKAGQDYPALAKKLWDLVLDHTFSKTLDALEDFWEKTY